MARKKKNVRTSWANRYSQISAEQTMLNDINQ